MNIKVKDKEIKLETINFKFVLHIHMHCTSNEGCANNIHENYIILHYS